MTSKQPSPCVQLEKYVVILEDDIRQLEGTARYGGALGDSLLEDEGLQYKVKWPSKFFSWPESENFPDIRYKIADGKV